MFKIELDLKGRKKIVLESGPRRALATMRDWHVRYMQTPKVTDAVRSYTEQELEALIGGSEDRASS